LTSGNLELVQILASWAASAPVLVAVVRLDERRLSPFALARAWPTVSRDAAVFALWMFGFHPAFVLAFFLTHFMRTRALLRGALLGTAWTLAVVAVDVGAQWTAATTVEWLGE
jgi:hypothetical protein